MDTGQEAQQMLQYIIRISKCKDSVRGRKDRKRIYREIAGWAKQLINDKRVKA